VSPVAIRESSAVNSLEPRKNAAASAIKSCKINTVLDGPFFC